jgi:hypothetical protein
MNQGVNSTSDGTGMGAAASTTNATSAEQVATASEDVEDISTIWDHPLIEKSYEPKKKWKCLSCDKEFAAHNATKGLGHVARVSSYALANNVQICKGVISDHHLKLARDLLDRKKAADAAKKRTSVAISRDIDEGQSSVVRALASKKAKPSVGHVEHVMSGLKSPPSSTAGTGRQHSIKTSVARSSTIDDNNTADMDVAIGDMIYCHGLPFNFGESPLFRKVIKMAKFAPGNYEPPKKNIVGGSLLDTSHDVKFAEDLKVLAADADVFGLCFLGDFATIKKAPLMNVLAAGHNIPPG